MTADCIGTLTMTDPDVIRCPFPSYRTLQDSAPVYRDPVTGYFEITRHADIREIAGNPSTFSNKFNRQNSRPASLQAELADMADRAGFPAVPTLLNNDPPDQRTTRSLVDKAFMPARITTLAPAIRLEVDTLIDGFIGDGNVEFMAHFAVPLPVNIISDQLGVRRDDRVIVKEGSDSLVLVADLTTPDDAMVEHMSRIIRMQRLLAERIHDARRTPDETILSNVVNDPEQHYEVPKLVHLFQSILVAGNETTTNALGNALLVLLRNEELQARLRSEPALIKGFVEETLRWKAPFQGFFRVATRDVEMHGVHIPEGSVLVLRWGAAGHDETLFSRPDEVNIDRENLGKHLSFGAGTHFCLGNVLARSELRIAFEQILSRMDNLRLQGKPGSAALSPTFFNQGVARIDMRFDQPNQARSKSMP